MRVATVSSVPWRGYAMAALGAALFASKAIVVKMAYLDGAAGGGTIDPISLLVMRMGFAAPIYLLIGGLVGSHRRKHKTASVGTLVWFKIGAVGAVGYYLASYLDFVGLTHITAQLERLTLFTYPAFVVVIGAVVYQTPISRASIVGFGVSYAGLAFVLVQGEMTASDNLARGVLLVIGAAISFAVYQLAAQPLMKHTGSLLFTCVAMVGAACAASVHFAFFASPDAEQIALMLSPKMLTLAGILACGCTVAPSFLLNGAIARIGAQAVAIIGTVSPIVTVVLAIVLLDEPFGWQDAVGSALVIFGVLIYVRFKDRR